MSKPLFLIIGKSGSGKTSVVNILKKLVVIKPLIRIALDSPDITVKQGHVFITSEEFDKLENIVAFTEYNNNRYAATQEQVDEADLYIIDIPGLESIMENYRSPNIFLDNKSANDRSIVVVYFKSNIPTRINRMLERGDKPKAILERLCTDEAYDWEDRIHNIVWNYKHNEERNIETITINANKSMDYVVEQIAEYMMNER